MKRRITAIAILAVLLLCGAVWARMTTVVVGQGVVSGSNPYVDYNTYWECDSTLVQKPSGSATLVGTASIVSSGCTAGSCLSTPSRWGYNGATFSHNKGTQPTTGEIEFDLTVSSSDGVSLFTLMGNSGYDYIQAMSTGTTTIHYRVSDTQVSFSPSINWIDGSIHHFKFTWNATTDSMTMQIDSGTIYSDSSPVYESYLNLNGIVRLGYTGGSTIYDKFSIK